MQSDFQLSAIHGMMYSSGNLEFTADGQSVLSPVLNSVGGINLQQGRNTTHRCCNSAVQCFDVTPDGDLLFVVGSRGLGMFYSVSGRVVLDTVSFPPQCSVGAAKFSPCGKYIALALENTLQIYTAPAKRIVTFHGCHRIENVHAALSHSIHVLEWTPDSNHVMIAGDDARIKILPRQASNTKGLAVMENNLAGHRSSVRLAQFIDDSCDKVISASTDNTVIVWRRTKNTRQEMMAVITEQKLVSRIEEYEQGDDEDDVEPSFIEKKKLRKMRKEGVKVSDAKDAHLPDVLRFAFETGKRFLLQHKGTVTVADYHKPRELLALGYNSGLFAIHNAGADDLPLVHILSISAQALTACRFSPSGGQVAFGSSHLKQLFVWDWKAESYVLKEQSHYYDINRVAVTPDCSSIVTGGEDGKVKVWNATTGQCFATFSEHSAGITGIAINPTTNAVFTASKDGTVRAFDLVRYRNFRVFHPPQPTQFSSLTVDPSGELLAAGTMTTNDIVLWSVQTGKVVELFTGHESPVSALLFHPSGTSLLSGSSDRSLVFWDVFNSSNEGERLRGHSETIETNSEVLAVSFSRNGRLGAALMLNSEVVVFDCSVPANPVVVKTFRTNFDAAGGWTASTGPNSANADRHFTSIAFSPDGLTLLLGGDSKWICLYHASQGFLLKKWPVTTNLDVEGAEEQYQYKKQSEAGVLDDIDVGEDDIHLKSRKLIEMPGSKHQHFATGKRKTMLTARTLHLTFAEHGREFFAATTDGLLHFSADVSRPKFAPLQLQAEVTPDSVVDLLQKQKHSLALCGSLMLQDELLGRKVMRSTPASSIGVAVGCVPSAAFPTLVQWVARDVAESNSMQHALLWARAVLTLSNEPLFGNHRSAEVAPALKLLHRAMHDHDALHQLVDSNTHKLRFLAKAAVNV